MLGDHVASRSRFFEPELPAKQEKHSDSAQRQGDPKRNVENAKYRPGDSKHKTNRREIAQCLGPAPSQTSTASRTLIELDEAFRAGARKRYVCAAPRALHKAECRHTPSVTPNELR
jgi:hypothetical protein